MHAHHCQSSHPSSCTAPKLCLALSHRQYPPNAYCIIDIQRQCQLELVNEVPEALHPESLPQLQNTDLWVGIQGMITHSSSTWLARHLPCISFAGTGTLKQSKGHGLSSTDIPSKSASLPEPVGTLSSTSLGHNTAKEAADGELRFSEAADHLTVTTVMTGQAVAKAVTMQVKFLSAQLLSACLSVCLAVSHQLCLDAYKCFACLVSVCMYIRQNCRLTDCLTFCNFVSYTCICSGSFACLYSS